MSLRGRPSCTVIDSPSPPMAPVSTAGEAAWPADSVAILDDNEIVQFSIKPSMWFILAVSYKFTLVMLFLCAITWSVDRQGWLAPWSGSVISFWLALAAARVGVAALQWASRLYVLTNRRVLCFRGVFNVRCSQCLLTAVSAVDLQLSWCARWKPLGHIRISSVNDEQEPVCWSFVGSAVEVNDLLVRAIRRSQFDL